MFPLDVQKAMYMGKTHAEFHAAGASMAHHDTLGIVTADSLLNKDKPDTSAIADNPPVAGAAGASDPAIAEAVRGIRARLLPLASNDRGNRASGQYDESKTNPDDPGPTFLSGFSARSSHRSKKR